MKAAFVATFFPVSALAAAGKFSYDTTAPFGPDNWAAIDIPDNECGGSFQSGIDIPSQQCGPNDLDDYVFTVS